VTTQELVQKLTKLLRANRTHVERWLGRIDGKRPWDVLRFFVARSAATADMEDGIKAVATAYYNGVTAYKRATTLEIAEMILTGWGDGSEDPWLNLRSDMIAMLEE
jgi:hypothetical protein